MTLACFPVPRSTAIWRPASISSPSPRSAFRYATLPPGGEGAEVGGLEGGAEARRSRPMRKHGASRCALSPTASRRVFFLFYSLCSFRRIVFTLARAYILHLLIETCVHLLMNRYLRTFGYEYELILAYIWLWIDNLRTFGYGCVRTFAYWCVHTFAYWCLCTFVYWYLHTFAY